MTKQPKALGFRSEDPDQLLGGVEKPEDSEAPSVASCHDGVAPPGLEPGLF